MNSSLSPELEKSFKTLFVDFGFFYSDLTSQMCVVSAQTETPPPLPRGGMILTYLKQLGHLTKLGKSGKAGTSSGDGSEGMCPAPVLAWPCGGLHVAAISFNTARKKAWRSSEETKQRKSDGARRTGRTAWRTKEGPSLGQPLGE